MRRSFGWQRLVELDGISTLKWKLVSVGAQKPFPVRKTRSVALPSFLVLNQKDCDVPYTETGSVVRMEVSLLDVFSFWRLGTPKMN